MRHPARRGQVLDCQIGDAAFDALQKPRVAANSGQRTAGLRFGCAWVQALLCALLTFRLLPRGFDNRQLREHLAPLLGVSAADWSAGRMTYDLSRLRVHGLIERIPRSRRYRVTTAGIRTALCTSVRTRACSVPHWRRCSIPTHPETLTSSAMWKRSTVSLIGSGRAMTPDLSEAQEQELQRWVRRAKTAQALVLRARSGACRHRRRGASRGRLSVRGERLTTPDQAVAAASRPPRR